MTAGWQNLHRWRNPLFGALAALIGATLLAGWSFVTAQNAEQEHLAASNNLAGNEARWRQHKIDQAETLEHWQIAQGWQNAGLLGAENRLAWSELLHSIRHDLRLPGMNYEFAAQKPLEAEKKAAYAHFSSTMRLHLRLLHEGDLLNFLSRLQAEASALVLIESCQLSPIAGFTEKSLPHINADCALQWITLRPVSPKP